MKEADLEMALVMAAQREKRCEEQEVQMRFREMAVFARERAANAIWMQAASRIQWCPGCVKTQLATGGLTPEEFQDLMSRDQC
jgi:2'-5' RNA ligase